MLLYFSVSALSTSMRRKFEFPLELPRTVIMVFTQGNTSLTASSVLTLLNMLINMPFIINITFFNYIGAVLSSKSKPGPNIPLKHLHTWQCQPRVWHCGFFLFLQFLRTLHTGKSFQGNTAYTGIKWFLLILVALFAEPFQAVAEKSTLASTSWACARAYTAQHCWAAAAVSHRVQTRTSLGSANGEPLSLCLTLTYPH